MGAVTDALAASAREAGAALLTDAQVTSIEADGARASVTWLGGDGERSVDCTYVLANVAPATLATLRGRSTTDRPEGSQLKVNLLLSRLPRLRSGDNPAKAFAGTFHIDEDYSQLQTAYESAADGRPPRRTALGGLLPLPHRPVDPRRRPGPAGLPDPHRLRRPLPRPVVCRRQRCRPRRVRTPSARRAGVLPRRTAGTVHRPRRRGSSVHRGQDAVRHRGLGRHARRPHLPRRPAMALGDASPTKPADGA